jgi:hypothetical protein
MIDEGSSTIMATIIGAGRKNNDNTFSGILLGEVKDGDDSSDNNFILVDHVTEGDFYEGAYYFKDDNNNFT